MLVYRTASTEAIHVLAGVLPFDLKIILRGIVFKVKKGLSLIAHDWVRANDLENREIKSKIFLLDGYLFNKWK